MSQEQWDTRHETEDVRQEMWDRRFETGDMRQETWGLRCETWDVRQETWDRRQETRDMREETGDVRQEIWEKRQACENGDMRHETGDWNQSTLRRIRALLDLPFLLGREWLGHKVTIYRAAKPSRLFWVEYFSVTFTMVRQVCRPLLEKRGGNISSLNSNQHSSDLE